MTIITPSLPSRLLQVDHPHVVRLHEVIDPPGSNYLMMVMEYCEGGCVMETRQQTGLAPLGEEAARESFRQACLGLDYLHYNNVVRGEGGEGGGGGGGGYIHDHLRSEGVARYSTVA